MSSTSQFPSPFCTISQWSVDFPFVEFAFYMFPYMRWHGIHTVMKKTLPLYVYLFFFWGGEKVNIKEFLYCRESVKNKAIYLFTSSSSPPAAKHRMSERVSVSTCLASPRLPRSKNSWAPLSSREEGGLQNVCCWNFSHTLKHKMDSSPFSTGEQKKKKK